jgi:opacity protein-like surface antigen
MSVRVTKYNQPIKKSVILLLFLVTTLLRVEAQVPTSLAFAPDGCATGMGDIGIATSPDAASQHWNVSKYALSKNSGEISLSYIPWMRDLADDMNLFYLSGYWVIGEQALSASLRYFSTGEIKSENSTSDITSSPKDIAFDLGYSRRFGERFSLGLAFRYIATNYMERTSGLAMKTSSAFAADLGAYYKLPISEDELTFGLALKNVGTKVKVNDNDKVNLPINLGIGTQYQWILSKSHILCFALDINKPLISGENNDNSIVNTIYSSFSNSFNQLTLAGGVEYGFLEKMLLRAGYHHSFPGSDGLKLSYVTFGVGVNFFNLNLDISYLVTMEDKNSALNNTLRFTLGYTFAKSSK